MTLIDSWGRADGSPQRAMNFFNSCGCNPYTGYGRLELGLAKALVKLRVGFNTCWVGTERRMLPDPDLPTLVTGFAEWLEDESIAGTRKWILTQSESTRVSQGWVDLINAHAEGVFVTNPDLVDIYRNSGVVRPVVCAGHGIELTHPVQAAGWDGESRFEWLTYSYGDLRKGAELAIMAFKRLFQGDEGHHLTIKARDHDAMWLNGLKDPQITVVRGQQSESEWMGLLARSHAFLFPSRAEGFGMPPREATLAGLPTIATEWLGMADVVCWGFPLKYTMRRCHYDTYAANAKGALWSEPDLDHLMRQMQWIYTHYGEAVSQAVKGARYLKMNNRWDDVAGRIVEVMFA